MEILLGGFLLKGVKISWEMILNAHPFPTVKATFQKYWKLLIKINMTYGSIKHEVKEKMHQLQLYLKINFVLGDSLKLLFI